MRALIVATVLLFAAPALAKPTFGVQVGEAYVLVFKDGVSAGSATTRFDVTMGIPLASRLGIGFGIGATMPNDILHPAPRASLALSFRLTEKFGLGFGPGYQYNPAYGGKSDSHFIGLALAPSYKIGSVTLLLLIGSGWTSGVNLWGLLFQPTIGYTF